MVKHIEPSDCVLFLTCLGLSEKEKQDIKKHIEECEKCKKQMEQTKQTLKTIHHDSKIECEVFEDDLVDHIDGKLPVEQQKEVKAHLDQCSLCNSIYEEVKSIPPIEAIEQLPISIPPGLWTKLSKTLKQEFAKTRFKEITDKAKSRMREISREISSAINEFVLILEPISLPLAVRTRGITKPRPPVINHHGGDLCLKLGKSEIQVRIFSLDGRQREHRISDKNGLVIFKNLPQGSYRINVKDHHVVDIKTDVS